MFGLTPDAIKVTDLAKDYLKKQLTDEMAGIRFSILTGKGCGGSEYDIKPVMNGDDVTGDDTLILDDSLTIYIPKTDVLRFFGMTIDFITDNLGCQRIEIINPNEASKCGCGMSVNFDK